MNKNLFLPTVAFQMLFLAPSFSQQPVEQFYGPHDPNGKKFIVQVYYNYIVPPPPAVPWITQTEAHAQAHASLNLLNTYFNPYNIFFVGKNGACDGSLGEVFFYDLANLYDPDGLRTSIPAAVHGDGIDIYITGNNFVAEEFGVAGQIPSNYCLVKGLRSPSPITETEVMVHEIGHCLGLSHTFVPGGPGSCTQTLAGCTPCSCSTHPPGFCCGDYVDDTEINLETGSIAVEPATCEPTDTSIPASTVENLMSYVSIGSCRTKFTPGQVLRMRDYLLKSTILDGVQPTKTINNPPGNVTYWNTPQTPPSNIIVPSGQTLIINATVEMSANSYIYVEKGAVLKVNATITGGCGKMWQGIIVDGDRDLLQTPQNQGYVGVYANGVIEHAICGIQVQGLLSNGFDNPAGGGGIVLVTAGKFRNCITGVKYASYLKQANKGKFLAAQFTINADFRGGSSKVLFVDLAGTYGIFLSGGIYKDERATCANREDRATAIQAYDAGFIATGAQFESLDFGAHVSTLSLNSGAFSITGNTFTDCFTSIFTSLASGYRISGNTFNMNRPDVCDNQVPQLIVGIRSVGLAAGVIIANNTFVNGGADQGSETLLGTDCNDIGTTNNLVMSNDFAFIDIGNRSSGINGQSSNEGMIFSGLLYECNTHETSLEGDFLVENGQVRRVQGEIKIDEFGNLFSTAAGNIFTLTNDFGFRNNGLSLTYFFNNIPEENPGSPPYSTGIISEVADESNETCFIAENCLNPPCPEEWFITTKEQFFQKKTQWKNKLLAFPAIPNPPQQIKAGKEISQLRLDLDRDGRQIVQNYQLDTNLLKIDSVITWLSNLETYEADYHIARHYFFSGNTALADSLFAILPTKYSLNEERLGMHASVLEVLDILRPFLTSNGELNPLSSGSLASLESYNLCDEAGYLARQILEKNGVSVTTDCIIPEPKPALSSVNNIARRISGLSVFPNPVSETLNIVSPIENLTAIRLLDFVGRVVAQSEQSVCKQEVTFSVKNHKPGIYCLEAVSEKGIVEYLKIVIYH